MSPTPFLPAILLNFLTANLTREKKESYHVIGFLSGTFIHVICGFNVIFLSVLLHHLKISPLIQCLRPYPLEYTSSRPITEVKQG